MYNCQLCTNQRPSRIFSTLKCSTKAIRASACSAFQLRKYVREDDNACRPQENEAFKQKSEWQQQDVVCSRVQPDCVQRDGKEMVYENKRIANDARKKAAGSVDTVTA
jgi:hypothetical protein